ncbi:ATP-dependent acyl-CoA ligase [Aeromicrobium halocynthiae]|uniref:ATP-dependent acyl-CoA ligase n=1 Tax=Aeromicrobium halocynthiae TaxID=560557 RepID=A0ABN2VY00_9ACTN
MTPSERLEFDFSTAVEALDHHARTTPDRVAVHYGETGQDTTYAELARTTDLIAGNLADRGLRPGAKVSVLTTQPLVATLAMFGAWKAGCLYAPINFQYTQDLLAYQLNDTDPDLLVVDVGLLPAVQAVHAALEQVPPTVVVGGEGPDTWDSLLAESTRPDVVVEWDMPANIIYTSGTTGPSKGVVQLHRWVNQYCWLGRRMLTPDDVVYNDLPMYHVGGAHFNVTRAIWSGASVSLWDRFSPHDFWRRIRGTGCTAAVLLDVMIPWLLGSEPSDDDRANPLNKVHMQPLPATHHEFAVRFGIDFVTSGFGQSEGGNPLAAVFEQLPEGEGTPPELYRGRNHAQVHALVEAFDLVLVRGDEEVPKGIMGRELPHMEVTVRDTTDDECPPGQVGELCMRPRSPGVLFHEYLAKPAATVQAWRNLWFHTGDAAFADADGIFYYVDRLGDRIRVRGENISSFHVEELLAKHESVQLAAVVSVPSAVGDEDEIVAFIEMAEGHSFDANSLRSHCESTMPKFMRPRDVIVLEQIPRTPTNKIEKYKLRKQFLEGTPS